MGTGLAKKNQERSHRPWLSGKPESGVEINRF
jgi:hypothetical protein